MGVFVAWISANWFSLFQTLGIVGALVYNGYSIRINARIRKVEALMNITQQHRSIWFKYLELPALKRVLSHTVDFKHHPLSEEEAIFVNIVILHVTTVLIGARDKIFPKPDGFDVDVQDFFSMPIPNAVWQRMKAFRDAETIAFVERLLIKQQ